MRHKGKLVEAEEEAPRVCYSSGNGREALSESQPTFSLGARRCGKTEK